PFLPLVISLMTHQLGERLQAYENI
ncbi:MAG: hypothetical protein AVDCRST_MAG95-1811, partial [uncultured Adhaeribacter sp.]